MLVHAILMTLIVDANASYRQWQQYSKYTDNLNRHALMHIAAKEKVFLPKIRKKYAFIR